MWNCLYTSAPGEDHSEPYLSFKLQKRSTDVFLAWVVHSMLYRSSNLLSKKFATMNCRWKGALSVRQLSVAHVRSISDWGEILVISTTVGGSSGLLRGCAQGSPSICKYPMERLPLISRRTASAFVHTQKHCQVVEQNSITTTTSKLLHHDDAFVE